MPNWCDNRLTIRGAPERVTHLVNTLEEADTPLDFERILPIPKAIRNGADYVAPGLPEGFPGWYQWSREHWGVKWNACNVARKGVVRTGRVRYRFDTAYNPPIEFLDALAARYPDLQLDLTFDVEMWGGGRASWREGALTELEDDYPF